jgi:hypothetical protein
MNKIIIVPDVHGRSFWKKIKHVKDTPIIFLGDYLDPYGHEGISNEKAIENFKEIIEFAKENSNVVLLYGNHCVYSYNNILDRMYYSSRYDYDHAVEAFKLYDENRELFKYAHQIDNILFTHAGVTTKWIHAMELEGIVNEENIAHYLNTYGDESKMFLPGMYRGGWGYGSPLWADLQEMYHWSAFADTDLIQIIGHTQLNNTGTYLSRRNFYCCDSREVFVFDGNLKVYQDETDSEQES